MGLFQWRQFLEGSQPHSLLTFSAFKVIFISVRSTYVTVVCLQYAIDGLFFFKSLVKQALEPNLLQTFHQEIFFVLDAQYHSEVLSD